MRNKKTKYIKAITHALGCKKEPSLGLIITDGFAETMKSDLNRESIVKLSAIKLLLNET